MESFQICLQPHSEVWVQDKRNQSSTGAVAVDVQQSIDERLGKRGSWNGSVLEAGLPLNALSDPSIFPIRALFAEAHLTWNSLATSENQTE